MINPKISILIPTYNRAVYLKDAVESCLAQDYENLEIIVSDNASTDNTEELIKKYLSDKRLKYIKNSKNVGLFPNWIKLLYEYASGDYGTFLPDDDYFINPKHISEAIKLIEKYNVNYIITDSIFDDEVRGIAKKINFNIPEYLSVDWAINNIGRRFTDNMPFSPGLPSLFNIQKAKDLKVLYPQVCGSDGEMGIRFMLDGSSAYMKNPQRFARGHSNSAGNTDEVDNTFKAVEIFDRAILFGLQKGYDKNKLMSFKRRNVILWISTIMLPPWFKTYGNSYLNFCIKLFKRIKKYKIDFLNYLQIIVSKQIVGRFIFEKNKYLYKKVRNIFWLIKYRKKYPQEYENKK